MSKRIVVSPSTHDMISAHSRSGFVYPVQKTADGNFLIDLDEEVLVRLANIDPDPETAIRTLCSGQMGRA